MSSAQIRRIPSPTVASIEPSGLKATWSATSCPPRASTSSPELVSNTRTVPSGSPFGDPGAVRAERDVGGQTWLEGKVTRSRSDCTSQIVVSASPIAIRAPIGVELP